jgi:hypothetical protein
MRAKTFLLALAFCLAAAVASHAADSNVGTWKLNDAKSKIPAGGTKITSVVYTPAGEQYKCEVDETDGSGKALHTEWTGKFDGKDYPVTGEPNTDTRSVQKVDDHHYKITNKKGGKATLTGNVAFSADGKTRTLTTNATDAKGKKIASTYVFDKQ